MDRGTRAPGRSLLSLMVAWAALTYFVLLASFTFLLQGHELRFGVACVAGATLSVAGLLLHYLQWTRVPPAEGGQTAHILSEEMLLKPAWGPLLAAAGLAALLAGIVAHTAWGRNPAVTAFWANVGFVSVLVFPLYAHCARREAMWKEALDWDDPETEVPGYWRSGIRPMLTGEKSRKSLLINTFCGAAASAAWVWVLGGPRHVVVPAAIIGALYFFSIGCACRAGRRRVGPPH